MEYNPRNYYEYQSDDPEIAFRADSKQRRTTKSLLRNYGVDKRTRNILVNTAGFRGVQEIYDTPDEELLAIDDIGRVRLRSIRGALLRRCIYIV